MIYYVEVLGRVAVFGSFTYVVNRNSYNLNMDQPMRASNHTLLVHSQIYLTAKETIINQHFALLLTPILMNKYV